MDEWEALIQRREMLSEKISKMDYELGKIDRRLVFLGRTAVSEKLDQFDVPARFGQEVY
jgi:hypothetical protein